MGLVIGMKAVELQSLLEHENEGDEDEEDAEDQGLLSKDGSSGVPLSASV